MSNEFDRKISMNIKTKKTTKKPMQDNKKCHKLRTGNNAQHITE